MLSLNIKIDKNIQKIDLKNAIQKSLVQSGYIVSSEAKQLAPYRSGNLRRSIQPDLTQVIKNIVYVGSNAKYARIQELGGVIKPKKAKMLAWKDKGKWYRAKKVNIKGKFYLANALENNQQKIYNTFLNNIKNEL